MSQFTSSFPTSFCIFNTSLVISDPATQNSAAVTPLFWSFPVRLFPKYSFYYYIVFIKAHLNSVLCVSAIAFFFYPAWYLPSEPLHIIVPQCPACSSRITSWLPTWFWPPSEYNFDLLFHPPVLRTCFLNQTVQSDWQCFSIDLIAAELKVWNYMAGG